MRRHAGPGPSPATGRIVGAVVTAMLLAAACTGTAATPTTPTTLPTAVVAEFETPDGARYRVLLEGEAAAQAGRAFAAGEHPGIPNGIIRPGDGGVNLGHDWHVIEVEFAEMAIEVCDGTVSYVDSLGYDGFIEAHGDRFCPWAARLVGLIEG